MQRDAHVLALAALRLVRKIVGPTHGALNGLARRKLHRKFLDAGNRLAAAEDDPVVLTLRHRAVFVGRREQEGHHVAGCWLGLHRMPARALLAHLLDLVTHLVVGDLPSGTCDAESLRASQRNLRANLYVQLEREWLALVELEIMNVGLRRNLQMLAIDNLLKRFLHQ